MARHDPNEAPCSTLPYETLELEPYHYAIRAACAERGLRNVEVNSYFDQHIRAMIVELRATTYGHKAHTEIQEVPWSRTVSVELPEPRWHPAPAAVAAVGLTFAAIAAGSLLLALTAMAVALVGVWLLSRPHPTVQREVMVHGTVKVDVSAVDTFPESTIAYPAELGRSVRIPVLSTARGGR